MSLDKFGAKEWWVYVNSSEEVTHHCKDRSQQAEWGHCGRGGYRAGSPHTALLTFTAALPRNRSTQTGSERRAPWAPDHSSSRTFPLPSLPPNFAACPGAKAGWPSYSSSGHCPPEIRPGAHSSADAQISAVHLRAAHLLPDLLWPKGKFVPTTGREWGARGTAPGAGCCARSFHPGTALTCQGTKCQVLGPRHVSKLLSPERFPKRTNLRSTWETSSRSLCTKWKGTFTAG